ncbi:MAG: pilus assembly protein TadG-related protein [Dehalococcoidia bacterium]
MNKRGQRAQVLPIMALLLIAFIGMLGLAIDVGRLFVAKTEFSRAVDAAALAGVVELPNIDAAQDKAVVYLDENLEEAVASFPATDEDYQLRVSATRSVDMFFMGIFGFDEVDISATATAGFGVPIDIVIVLDDTGTMRSGCNVEQTNSDCPIKQAKDASHAFVDDLLGDDPTGVLQIGVVRFRGCYADQRYNPVSGEDPDRGCVLFDEFQDLTTNKALLHAALDNAAGLGGFPGTNLCAGLDEGLNVVTDIDSRPNSHKVIVILSDGDNRYSDGAQNSSRGNPVPNVYPLPNNGGSGDCMPPSPDQDGTNYGNDYDDRIDEMDNRTYQKAMEIRGQSIEIYVAGYKVSGAATSAFCDTTTVTNVGGGSSRQAFSSPDDLRDRNLNKCIASSTAGTNDHHFEAPAPEDIPAVFDAIAESIAFRLIE